MDIEAPFSADPTADECARRDACAYARLLPEFSGAPASLAVNRNAPAAFAVV